MNPPLERSFGWQWAFAFLAAGPAVGIWALQKLRRLPESVKPAAGRRQISFWRSGLVLSAQEVYGTEEGRMGSSYCLILASR